MAKAKGVTTSTVTQTATTVTVTDSGKVTGLGTGGTFSQTDTAYTLTTGNGKDYAIVSNEVSKSGTITTGNGKDSVTVNGAGNHVIRTNNGDDIILAGAGDDDLFGGNGMDNINGRAGVDEIWGDEGVYTTTLGKGQIALVPMGCGSRQLKFLSRLRPTMGG
jgi:Ca2+-binding RTX toxin-like protein